MAFQNSDKTARKRSRLVRLSILILILVFTSVTAFLGMINRLGRFRVKRNDSTCTHCKACDKACPGYTGCMIR